MKSTAKDIVVYVMSFPDGKRTRTQIKNYEAVFGKPIRILLIKDSRVQLKSGSVYDSEVDIVISCDFSKPEKIAAALLPYQDQLLAITCRAEQHMARFTEVIPHVPYLRTPTTDSLRWASDKYEMRKRFRLFDKTITPKFTLVEKNTPEERERIIGKIGFPLIIKPTNMAGSLFVSICYHEEDLEKTLRSTFRSIKSAYKKDNRLEVPKVIAEEFMDGDLYSIDSYVDSRGRVYHCPLVKQITAKKIGRDDFYNYLQITPTGLKSTTVARAEQVAEKAIHALGLRSSIAHTELMKLDDEWKVVELGARMGGFRHTLHELSCDINHTLNDILIRVPKKPVIPKKCKGYSCAIKWYPAKEGIITEMKGVKKIEQLDSFHHIVMNKKIGDKFTFARNGGRSVFNLFMYNNERSKLLADIRRVEKLVDIKVQKRLPAK